MIKGITRYQHRIAFKPFQGISITRHIELIGGTLKNNRIKLKEIAESMRINGGFKSYKLIY